MLALKHRSCTLTSNYYCSHHLVSPIILCSICLIFFFCCGGSNKSKLTGCLVILHPCVVLFVLIFLIQFFGGGIRSKACMCCPITKYWFADLSSRSRVNKKKSSSQLDKNKTWIRSVLFNNLHRCWIFILRLFKLFYRLLYTFFFTLHR